jgi:hypothetical protein
MLSKQTMMQLKSELPNDKYIAILEDVTYTSHRVISSPKTDDWPEFMVNEVRALNQRIKEIKEK